MGTGISILQFANMNLTRNIFVVGFSIFMGLSVPEYFREFTLRAGHGPVHTHARWVSVPLLKMVDIMLTHRRVFYNYFLTTFETFLLLWKLLCILTFMINQLSDNVCCCFDCPVQRHPQHLFLFCRDCGLHSGVSARHHSDTPCFKEGQGNAMDTEVQALPARSPELRVLQIASRPAQVLPSNIRARWQMTHWRRS